MCVFAFAILELPVQQCVTPDRKRGGCVDLRQCAALFSLIQKPGISYEDRNFLRQSQCAYINNYPWVKFKIGKLLKKLGLSLILLLLQVCCPYDAQPPATQPPSPTNPQNTGNSGVSLRASDLPAPGICGFSVDDRIVGGNETR